MISKTLDDDGQPRAIGLNWHQNLRKALSTLYGICGGLMADSHLSDQEILFLHTWLRQNEELTKDWPANILAQRVESVLADGLVTEEERQDLQETLKQMLGGTLEETGSPESLATRLPVDPLETVNFEGRTFCLTGKFIYGPRSRCQSAIEQLGGIPVERVSVDLSYLIIGTLASRDWVHTSHGRKIETALGYKAKGHDIQIAAEELWVRFIP